MGITIRELLTKWGFKSDVSGVENFQRKLGAAKRVASVAAKGMVVLGGAAAAAGYGIFKLTSNVARSAHEIERARTKTGLSAETLQELQFAARRTQVPFEAIVLGMKKVAVMAQAVAHGNKAAKQAFNELEVDAIDPTTKKMKSMGDIAIESVFALGDVKDETMQLALAQKFFGRGGVEVLNLLRDGRVELAQMMGQAKKSVLTEDELKAGVKFTQSMSELDYIMNRLKKRLGVAFLPMLTDIIQKLEKWGSANAKLIASKIPEVVQELVDAFRELTKDIDVKTLKEFFSDLKEGLSVTSTILKGIGWAIRGVMKALKWLGTAIGEVVAEFYLYFANFWDDTKSQFNWLRAVISNIGSWFSNALSSAWASCSSFFSAIGEYLSAAPGAIWDAIAGGFQNAIAGAVNALVSAYNWVKTKLGKFWGWISGDSSNKSIKVTIEGLRNVSTAGAKIGTVGQSLSTVSSTSELKTTNKNTTNNISPTINVNMPPGASKSDYEKAADVMNKKLRRTLTDMTPGGA